MRCIAFAIPLLLVAQNAFAADAFVECPPGSTKQEEGSYTWCQPSVCGDDTQCAPNVCRPVGLCMQIGSLNKPGEPDGGQRLIATQICQEDKQCPTQQTCSLLKRCVSQAQADKLAANAAPATPAEPAKKSGCGCETVGVRRGSSGNPGALGAFGVALSALLVRAARRGSRRKSR